MSLPIAKFIDSVLYMVVLLVSEVNRTSVTEPEVRMDYYILMDTAPNDYQQRFPDTVRDDLGY